LTPTVPKNDGNHRKRPAAPPVLTGIE
jgi:hypothetical protein